MILGIETEILVYSLAAVALLMALWIITLELRLKRLLRGRGGKSLEDAIGALGKDVQSLFDYRDSMTSYLGNADERIKRSVQGVETVRFNPFADTGGKQSFSTAILSESGDGVVLSGIHARGETRLYAKPVKGFASEHELIDEERRVIEQSRRLS
jgi:hypothetical protein